MKNIMDLNQAEVAVTTQHLIDMGQEKDNLLQMSDFGDMGEFLCTCSGLFPEEETPEYRYTRWEEIPDLLINREWLCPNFFEIREAMEQLEEYDKDCFFDWCARCGYDISTEDPHLLVAHYIELYGNAPYIVDVNRFLINRNANPRFGSLSGYFRWSFSDNHFTLWQRVEYNSPLCFSRRIFSIHFGMLASRDRKRDNTVMN